MVVQAIWLVVFSLKRLKSFGDLLDDFALILQSILNPTDLLRQFLI